MTVHRHGTLKGRWKALAFGAFWFVIGWLIARVGWSGVFAGSVPRAPSGGELTLIIIGGGLMLVGAVLGLVPHFLWLMRSFYKEDFAQGAQCPVMRVCPSCAVYNPLTRAECRACGSSMAGALRAGAEERGPGDAKTA